MNIFIDGEFYAAVDARHTDSALDAIDLEWTIDDVYFAEDGHVYLTSDPE